MIFRCPEITECKVCGCAWDQHWCDGPQESYDWEDVWYCSGPCDGCYSPQFLPVLPETCSCEGV